MGFYLRRSVSVGPFRFNLSKSGIGVSTGVKGFRIGTGPRGNYVQMGYGGIYFRQTLSSPQNRHAPLPPQQQTISNVVLTQIESGDVSQMIDSSSAALLEEINSKSRKARIWPCILALGVCLLGLCLAEEMPMWVYILALLISAAGTIYAAYVDKLRKTVVLLYDLEPHIEHAYQNLHNAFDRLRACSRMWRINSAGDLRTAYDRKIHAGANTVIARKLVRPSTGSPPYFKSNILMPVLPTSRGHLYFLPDRILVWHSAGVGAVSFDELMVNPTLTNFIESDGVPSDTQVVGRTWRYVNKDGGPDRRFNDNREIPVVRYEEMLLSSRSGLRELFQVSKTGLGADFNTALKGIAIAISQRKQMQSDEDYIKCPCNNCDVYIEFPSRGVGQQVTCPHCGLQTVLFKPEPAPR